MERETKKITTPSGNKVIMKTYITGFEEREIRDIYLKDADISTGEIGKLDVKLANEAENKTIEIIVVSLDGDDKDVVNRILNLKRVDYDFIIAEINDITGVKKKSS